MKLLIKKPFEFDVELFDQLPTYLKLSSNWVVEQSIEVTETDMTSLLSILNYSSYQFNHTAITYIDNSTISWG